MTFILRKTLGRVALTLPLALVGLGAATHGGPATHASGLHASAQLRPPCLPCPK